MKDTIKINNKRNKMKIFKRLLSVQVLGDHTKSQKDIWKEINGLEKEGKLRIYKPEA